jgi:hypothetical protein
MAKVKEEKPIITSEMQAQTYLKNNAADHYNFEEDNYYKTPCSSMIFNTILDGGLCPGAHRFVGINSGGKTSSSLDFMLHFLKEKPGSKDAPCEHRGVFFKCEGRLSPEVQARSGVTFTSKPEEWIDGTCFVFESNIYETIFGFIRELIVNNPQKTKYFFIIDSVDNMIKKDDMAKALDQASQVSGGANITSLFLKKVGLALCKRGHIAIFISQIRDTISIGPYAPPPQPRQGKSSGGHSLEHNSNTVVDFLHRQEKDIIREGSVGDGKEESEKFDAKAKIIGHWCKIKLIKTDNERNGITERYPIKYGRTGGKSIWREHEVVVQLQAYGWLNKAASWFTINEQYLKDIREVDPDFPEKVQGTDSLRELLESKPKVTDYLHKRFSDVVINS